MSSVDPFNLDAYRARLAAALGTQQSADPAMGEGPAAGPPPDLGMQGTDIGGGPSIDEDQGGDTAQAAPAAPQSASIGQGGSGPVDIGGGTPSLDMAVPPPAWAGGQPQQHNVANTPSVPSVPSTPRTPSVKNVKAGPTAPVAPSIGPAPHDTDTLQDIAGMRVPGNINPKFDTKPIAMQTDQGIALIPTSIDGTQLSDADAKARYASTGQNLGVFSDDDSATTYAASLANTKKDPATDTGPGAQPHADPNPGISAAGSVDGQSPGTAIDQNAAGGPSPAADHKSGKTLPDGRPVLNIHPPDFDPKDPSQFDLGKLAKAKGAGDMFDALTPSKQRSYMDWWQEQHGDIDNRYAQMQQDLGMRPDPNRAPTTKEKFQQLLDFGMSLLQGSGRGKSQSENVGNAMATAVGNQRQRQLNQTSQWDTRNAQIQTQKAEADKALGNYGQAVRQQALITDAQVRTDKDITEMMKPPKPGQPVTRVLNDGTQVEWDPNGKNPKTGDTGIWRQSVDDKGNPVKPNINVGARGGVGHQSGNTQQLDYLINELHMKPDDAVKTVYHVKPTGNAMADYTGLVKKFTPQYAQPEDVQSAKDEAEDVMTHLYGEGWMDQARRRASSPQLVPDKGAAPANAPPANLLQSGHVTTFKNGQRWTLGPNGQPQQVQ